MALHLHNTLSRTREPFAPADPRRVSMYVCGPTVYNFAHIGNARPLEFTEQQKVFDPKKIYGEAPNPTQL